jgi:hypothetical protein
MEIIELESWEKYCSAIEELQHQYEYLPIIFRGQSNFKKPLKTTLERFSKCNWTIRKYCKLVVDCIPQIKSFKEHPSNIPPISDIDGELNEIHNEYLVEIPNAISYYWTYLRHHGFPSPLLDWSQSPYIAAFFAFCESAKSRNVSIFAFIDSISGDKTVWAGKPQITAKWLNIYPHKRHARQQSCYTVATKPKNNDHQFVPHEHVFKTGEVNQDILIKYVIPISERIKALKFLDQKDINYFNLIESEEALLKTIAFRELELKTL